MGVYTKIRWKQLIFFSVTAFFLNLFLFNSKLIDSNFSLLQSKDKWVFWVGFIGLGILVYLSINIVKWSIEIKYLEKISNWILIVYWAVMFTALLSSVGLGLFVTKGFVFGNPIHPDNIIITLGMLLYAATSVSLWNSLYTWVAPSFAKIDYIKLKTLFRKFKNQIISLKTNENNISKLEYLNNNLLNLVKDMQTEIENNLLFENIEFQLTQLEELKSNLEILDTIFLEIQKDMNFSDLHFLAQEQKGGKVTNIQIQSLQYILSLQI